MYSNSWFGAVPLAANITEVVGSFGAVHNYTISGGVIAGDSAYKNIAIVGQGAADDDLDNITGYAEGDMIIISPQSDAVTITVKDSADMNLQGADFVMDDLNDSMVLLNQGSDTWKELSRSAN